MSENTQTYDAIIIPTGETRKGNLKEGVEILAISKRTIEDYKKGEESFPVTRRAIEEYKKGKYDCIFVTGGYEGFSKKKDGPLYRKISDAEETANFIKEMGIPEEKVYFDGRSYEGIGKFTFPLVPPIINKNPSFEEFDSALIFGEQGKMWKIRNYANLVLRDVSKLDFFTVPTKKDIPLVDILYYTSIMRTLHNYKDPRDIHAFLLQEHPFYSKGWFNKSRITRGLEMGVKGINWIRPNVLK